MRVEAVHVAAWVLEASGATLGTGRHSGEIIEWIASLRLLFLGSADIARDAQVEFGGIQVHEAAEVTLRLLLLLLFLLLLSQEFGHFVGAATNI